MNAVVVSYFARALMVSAELEAMKAANAVRALKGLSPAYGEDDFLRLATRLDEIQYNVRQEA